MNYSNNPHDVRVDIFNKDLTYHGTLSVRLKSHSASIEKLIQNEISDYSDRTNLKLAGKFATCSEPWNIDNRPVMMEIK